MKKILFLVVTAAAALTACNGNKQTGNETADSTAVETEQAAPEQAYDLEAITKVIDGAETVMGFSEGRASVINKDGKLGVIDMKGNVIIPFEYRYSVFRYSDGIICCCKSSEDLWCYFDHDGKKLFETHDGGASQFKDGFACKYSSQDGKYYFIDKEGKPAFNGKKWHWAESFSDGMALVNDGDGWGFIDTTGKLVIPCIYDSPSERNPEGFHEGLAPVVIDPAYERFGYIDKTGKQVFSRLLNADSPYSEGLCSAYDKDNECWGFMDKTGNFVISLDQGVHGDTFREGLALISKSGYPIGYIDKTGKQVITLEEGAYKQAEPFYEGLARVRKDKSYGFIDTTGKLVIPCEYTSCYENFSEGLVPAKKGEKWGYIARDGKSTFDF